MRLQKFSQKRHVLIRGILLTHEGSFKSFDNIKKLWWLFGNPYCKLKISPRPSKNYTYNTYTTTKLATVSLSYIQRHSICIYVHCHRLSSSSPCVVLVAIRGFRELEGQKPTPLCVMLPTNRIPCVCVLATPLAVFSKRWTRTPQRDAIDTRAFSFIYIII